MLTSAIFMKTANKLKNDFIFYCSPPGPFLVLACLAPSRHQGRVPPGALASHSRKENQMGNQKGNHLCRLLTWQMNTDIGNFLSPANEGSLIQGESTIFPPSHPCVLPNNPKGSSSSYSARSPWQGLEGVSNPRPFGS